MLSYDIEEKPTSKGSPPMYYYSIYNDNDTCIYTSQPCHTRRSAVHGAKHWMQLYRDRDGVIPATAVVY